MNKQLAREIKITTKLLKASEVREDVIAIVVTSLMLAYSAGRISGLQKGTKILSSFEKLCDVMPDIYTD